MAAAVRSNLLKHIVKIDEEYPLQDFSPLGAGGVADYFTVAENTIEVAAAVKAAIDVGIPYTVIGQGDKVVFSDSGFPGLVIQNKTVSFGMAVEKSQVVVDAGLPLDRCISMAASKGLGGMTQFYGEPGSIGGAIYSNMRREGRDFLSMIRYVTVLTPPSRLDTEATINRYKGEWLVREDGSLRLKAMKRHTGYEQHQPVILTAVLQLTSLRLDEIRLQMQAASLAAERLRPSGVVLGPLFLPAPDGTPADRMLESAEVSRLRVENLTPDRRFPNFIRCKGRVSRAEHIRRLMEHMKDKVLQVHGVELVERYEFLGVW